MQETYPSSCSSRRQNTDWFNAQGFLSVNNHAAGMIIVIRTQQPCSNSIPKAISHVALFQIDSSAPF
ncbi:hypothetical protein N9267_00590 [bacterium]|nr:hypothetical protein [bacterium]